MPISATRQILRCFPIEKRLDFLAELLDETETASSSAAAAATNVNPQVIKDTVYSILCAASVLLGKRISIKVEDVAECAQYLSANRDSFDALSKRSQINKAMHKLEIKKERKIQIVKEQNSLHKKICNLSQKIILSKELESNHTYHYLLRDKREYKQDVQNAKDQLASWRRGIGSLSLLNRAEKKLNANKKEIQRYKETIRKGNIAQNELPLLKRKYSLLSEKAATLQLDTNKLKRKIANLTNSYNRSLTAHSALKEEEI